LINLQNAVFLILSALLKSLAPADEQYFYHIFVSLFQSCVSSQIKWCKSDTILPISGLFPPFFDLALNPAVADE
jgi:hypothetical protein